MALALIYGCKLCAETGSPLVSVPLCGKPIIRVPSPGLFYQTHIPRNPALKALIIPEGHHHYIHPRGVLPRIPA